MLGSRQLPDLQFARLRKPGRQGFAAFEPDVLVEVTRVCDRNCPGCYAPNLASRPEARGTDARGSSVYLSAAKLQAALEQCTVLARRPLELVGLRGGEPSFHPELPELLRIARPLSRRLCLETHGRWIRDGNTRLLEACAKLGVEVKLSFDSMHGLRPVALRRLCAALDDRGVTWQVAITEFDATALARQRRRVPWLSEDRTVLQWKAVVDSALVEPRVAVVDVSGALKPRLAVRGTFRPE